LGAYAFYAHTTHIGAMPVQAEIGVGLTDFLLDTFRDVRHYLARPWARPALSLALARWATLRISYQLAYENYASGNLEGTNDDRDGSEHLFTLEGLLLLSSRIDLRVFGFGGAFAADGSQWSALFAGGGAEARFRVFSWLGAEAGIDYLRRDFGDSRYTTTGADLQASEVVRVDDRLAPYARVRFEIAGFQIGILYTYMRNYSTAKQIFDYARHIAGLEVGYRY
jgi:hypothetical protein